MTHELTMVVYTAILLFIMIGVQGGVGLLNNGLKWGGSARFAYALFYWLGTPWARTLVWAVGLVATAMLFVQAF